MSSIQKAATGLLLSFAVTTGLAADVGGPKTPLEADLSFQLDQQQRHAESRRKELEMEASLDGSSLAETKRLMRQEMKPDKASSSTMEETDEGDITSSKHYRRQQRAMSRSSLAGDASLLAGETNPGSSFASSAEEESDKDFASEHEPERKHCPEVYKIRGAEIAQPMRMGIFYKVPGSKLPLWENTNKEFLYFSPLYMEWRIGSDYRDKEAGVASTPNQNAACPHKATDWFAFERGNWTNQYNITLDVEECPIEVWITGADTSQENKLGSFYMTLHETFGRPVYENEQHMFLYYWPEFGEWRVGEDWKKPASGIASKRGEHTQCPIFAHGWTVYSGGSWKEADLKVYTERPNIFGGKPGTGGPEGEHGGPPDGNLTYKPGEFNENQCPLGTREMGLRECKQAAKRMGTIFGGVEDSEDKPRGCLMDKPESSESVGHVFFNKNNFGLANEANQPLCHTEIGMPVRPPQVKHSVVRLNAHVNETNLQSMHDPAANVSGNQTAEDEDEEGEFSNGGMSKMFTKQSKKLGIGAIVAIGLVVLIVVVWYVRRRNAQQKAEEEQAALAAKLAVGAKCVIKSSSRKAAVAEVGPDKTFKVTYDDDGKTSEEFIKIDDMEAPAEDAPKTGQL